MSLDFYFLAQILRGPHIKERFCKLHYVIMNENEFEIQPLKTPPLIERVLEHMSQGEIYTYETDTASVLESIALTLFNAHKSTSRLE